MPVAVLGLGGGGSRIVASLATYRSTVHMTIAMADTDASALRTLDGVTAIPLGSEWTHNQGCGGDMVLAEKAAGASTAALKAFISRARFLIVVVGLGGGAGMGAARVVARLARDARVTTICVATLPFVFEGSWKRKEADKGLASLRTVLDGIIVIPNDLLFTSLAADTPASEAFCVADTMLAEALSGLARLSAADALIPADFNSFRTVLRDRPGSSALGVGHGTGERRWEKALNNLLECPLLGGVETLRQASAVVVTILGGDDLSVGEIQSCLSAFQQHVSEETRLVTGAYSGAGIDDLQITVLACRYETAKDSLRSSAGPPAKATPRRAARRAKADNGQVQGELPLQEQTRGIFRECSPTTMGGEDLDIPTFQRRGVVLDIGE